MLFPILRFTTLWVFFVFSFLNIANSQPLKEYSPYAQGIQDMYLKKLSENYKEDKHRIVNSSYKKTIRSYYETRYISSKNRILNGHYILDRSFHEELQRVADKIAQKNKNYPFHKTSVFLSRYTLPNAFSIGDGTICINIGLLKDLRSEGELAFVLCHEFAHYFLDHSDKILIKTLESVNETSYQNTLKEIQKTEYYQISKYREFVRKNVYEDRMHSRLHELEADSLGLLLFENAGYAFNEAQSLIAILDNYNKIKENDGVDVFGALKTDSASYKEASLKVVDNDQDTFWDFNKLNTHPDCKLRAKVLKGKLNLQTSENILSNFNFFIQKVQSQYTEELWSQWLVDDLFVQTLKKISLDSISPVNNEMAVLVSYQVLKARTEHRINKYFRLPTEYKINSYINLSNLFYSLRIKQLQDVLFRYSYSCFKKSNQSARCFEAMIEIANMCEKKDIASALINNYKKQFSNQKIYK